MHKYRKLLACTDQQKVTLHMLTIYVAMLAIFLIKKTTKANSMQLITLLQKNLNIVLSKISNNIMINNNNNNFTL